ncbi:hypothetical protein BH23ACT2_BH23ACT2_10920 [soil metagenome]
MVERRTTPRRALGDLGDEPDARFSFANERTYLAWNRTALGSVVAGLAVANVLAPDDEGVGPELLGVALIGLGLVLAALSYINWFRNEQALRLRLPLPHSPLLLVLSVVTGLVALAAAVYTLS